MAFVAKATVSLEAKVKRLFNEPHWFRQRWMQSRRFPQRPCLIHPHTTQACLWATREKQNKKTLVINLTLRASADWINVCFLHNELTYVVLHCRQQGRLPPLHKPPQHITCWSFDAERVSIFENHQAHQHHADIQHFVILVKTREWQQNIFRKDIAQN